MNDGGQVWNPDWFMKVMNQNNLGNFKQIRPEFMARVIIWSYNRPNMVKQAIQSVFNQDYSKFEIFVVDDGSDIFEPESLQQDFRDSRLVVVKAPKISLDERAKKSRLGENTNFVIETFDPEDIVYYLCDDDIMAEKWLSRSMSIFANGNTHLIQGQTFLFEDGKAPYKAGFQYQDANALYMVAGSFAHRASCSLEEKILWEDNELLHSQDASFIRNIMSKHEDITIVSCPSLYRRIHKNNLSERLPDTGTAFKPRDGKITKEMLSSEYE